MRIRVGEPAVPQFCSSENVGQQSSSDERRRDTGPSFGPGGHERHATFLAQAQVAAWEGAIGARASWAGPICSRAERTVQIEPVSFFPFFQRI